MICADMEGWNRENQRMENVIMFTAQAKVIAFQCDLDTRTVPIIQRNIDEIDLSRTGCLIVDLGSVVHLTTAGAALLVYLCQRTKRTIVLANLSQRSRDLLSIHRLGEGIFELVDCRDLEPSITLKC